MNDKLITLISKNGKINGYICTLRGVIDEVGESQGLNLISKAVFARALSAAVLLSGSLKSDSDMLTLKWECTGPVGAITVQVNGKGIMRGNIKNRSLSLIESSIDSEGFRTEPYMGFGEFVVSRKLFNSNRDYNSVGVIETGEIAEDITRFLSDSMQIDSGLKLGLDISPDNKTTAAGGILLMAMPGASDQDIDKIEAVIDNLNSVTRILSVLDKNTIKKFADDNDLIVVGERSISFECGCNADKIKSVMKQLSYEEFTHYITDEGIISAVCEFCNKKYDFTPEEIRQ